MRTRRPRGALAAAVAAAALTISSPISPAAAAAEAAFVARAKVGTERGGKTVGLGLGLGPGGRDLPPPNTSPAAAAAFLSPHVVPPGSVGGRNLCMPLPHHPAGEGGGRRRHRGATAAGVRLSSSADEEGADGGDGEEGSKVLPKKAKGGPPRRRRPPPAGVLSEVGGGGANANGANGYPTTPSTEAASEDIGKGKEEEPRPVEGTSDDDYPTWNVADYVAVGTNAIETDPVLNYMSSELGVRMAVGLDPVAPALPYAVLLARTLDTVEDVFVILRRRWDEFLMERSGGEEDAEDDDGDADAAGADDERETVVVLGSGWAAHALLKVADTSKIRLVVVSPSNHFVFTPMLASAAVGTVEYRSMTEAVRAANPLIDSYVEGSATDVDIRRKIVTVKLSSLLEGVAEGEPPTIRMPYDRLVVSVGAQVAQAGVEGASRCLRLKSVEDARRLRTSIGECFEYATRPDVTDDPAERSRRVTFLIVGGGPTGVELAGEISDLAEDICRPKIGAYKQLRGSVKVVLAHSGPELLQQFDENMREEAGTSLARRGIDVWYNTYVTKVEGGRATLSKKCDPKTEKCRIDPDTGKVSPSDREEFVLPVGLTVWCAGTAPVPFVSKLLAQLPDMARGERGRVKVDPWCRPPVDDPSLIGSIFVLGDAANFASGGVGGVVGGSLPQTAQVAGQQGAYLARLLGRGYDLSLATPALPDVSNATAGDDALLHDWLRVRGLEAAPGFEFLNLGLLAYLGGGEALSQVQIGDFPIFKFAGSVSFVLWRSVYLVKQVATRNRMLVTFDWIKSYLFGRDITRL